MKKTLFVTSVIIVSALTVFTQFFVADKTSAEPSSERRSTATRSVPIVSATVAEHKLAENITVIGKLAANRSVYIAPEVAGKIKAIKVNANQNIVKDQVLILLEDAKSQANVAEANAYLRDEQRKLGEFEKLIHRNAITQTEIAAQKASVDIAKARLQAAQAQLNYHTIRAPFSGTAGLVDFSLGKMVNVGTELFSLDDLSSMRLDVYVPEIYLSRIDIGMTVTATSRAWPKDRFIGVITAIDPRINPDTLSLKVRINFDNKQHKLKPGMLMSTSIGFAATSAPVIPVQALEYSGTKRFVYVVDAKQIVKRTEVTLGARIDNEVLITNGVKVGDRIVVQGLVNMRDGLKIDDLSGAGVTGKKTLSPTVQGSD